MGQFYRWEVLALTDTSSDLRSKLLCHSLLSTKEERASTFPGFLISDGNRTLFPFAKTCFWKPPGSSSYTSPSEVRNTVSWTLPKCSRSSTAVVCDWNQKLCRPQRAKTTC